MSRPVSVGWFTRMALTAFIVVAAVSTAFLRVPLADQGAGIRSIAPPAAFVGDVVTITGAGFGGRNVRVFVGGVSATILDVVQGGGTPSSITFRVPLVPAGPTQVVAMNPGGRAWSTGFHVLNHPPVADAGLDQTVGVGTTMQLDGRGSTDVDGDALTFRWTIVARPLGSAATLSDPTILRPTFLVDRRGTYVVQLVVNDGGSDSAPDTVRIDTTNSAPVADAGPDQTVPRGAIVQLEGTGSSDVDGDLLAFRWVFQSRPPGSQATLTDASVDRPAFVADLPGRYVLELVVSDGLLDSKPATVRIDTRNSRPQSSAGDDLVVTVGTIVQLDGSASSDADGDPLGFRWSFTTRPAGSAAVLSDVTAIQPTFAADLVGTYVVQLIVNDPFEDGAPDTVVVTAQPATPANRAPTVSAGANQSITLPINTAPLNGSASDDGLPGGVLVTTWSKVTGPGAVIFANSSALSTTAQFSMPGTYVLRLTASDGALSASADVTVGVNPATGGNQPPVVNAGSNQTITLPASASLSGSVSDDGLPGPPGALTTTWSMVSGPGTTTFGDASALSTTASFSVGGTYVLRLTAADGELTASAQVTVIVNPAAGSGFTLLLDSPTASPFAGSTALVRFHVDRTGDFAAPITVGLLNAPAGISARTVQLSGRITDAALTVAVAAGVPPGIVLVDVAAEAAGSIQTARLQLIVRAAEPSARDKIDAAVAQGTLDRATSLLYRAYALVGDPRLPAVYLGSGSDEDDISVVPEIAAILPTVPPDMRALLEPFTLRPAAPGSWYNELVGSLAGASTAAQPRLRTLAAIAAPLPDSCDAVPANGWISRRSATWPVRVWAPCAADDATIATDFIERALAIYDRIWAVMTASPMGDPLPDRASNVPVDPADGVGDEAIDVYLVMADSVVKRLGLDYSNVAHALGWAIPWPVGGADRQKSGFITLPWTTVADSSLHTTAIHELFHVLQFAHNATVATSEFVLSGFGGIPNPPRYGWWYTEASARWAASHYDRRLAPWDAGRQAYNRVYFEFDQRFQPLRNSLISLHDPDGPGRHRPYEAFIWPYFMEQRGGAAVPANVWKAVEAANDPNAADDAMDRTFSFKDNFRDFAVRNLNSEFQPGDALPAKERYISLDDLFPDGVPPAAIANSDDDIVLFQGMERTVTVDVAPLAAHYSTWRVGDASTRKVVFDFTQFLGAEEALGVDVDAMVKIFGGGWKRHDYTGRSTVTFCMDDPAQALETLILVVSSPRLQPVGTASVKMELRVTASAAPCKAKWVGTSRTETEGNGGHFINSADVTWTLVQAGNDSDGSFQVFTPSGRVTVELYSLDTIPPCSVAPPSSAISSGPPFAGDGYLQVNYPTTGQPFASGQGGTAWLAKITCGDVTLPEAPFPAGWFGTDRVLLNDTRNEIAGTFLLEQAGITSRTDFRFRLVLEE